jgi:transposase
VSFIEGPDRVQVSLLPPSIEDYIAPQALVRVVDAFVDSLDLNELGFERTVAAATGRPGFRPGDMLRLYIWGYLNQIRSSRLLERACIRDLEALWLMRRLAPDYRTIAAFRQTVLVFGEPEAKPMGYGHSPKLPAYNLQSVVDVESGLIVHHDVCNDANDSHMLHPMSVAEKKVLETDELHVLTDGGYSNAAEVARCEDEAITVSAPIKRGAMNSERFRPTQFHYDETSDTIRCPAGQDLRPSGRHTRNRAVRYRTSACKDCRLKAQCTPGAQRTIHRLIDQGALDRIERRIYAIAA